MPSKSKKHSKAASSVSSSSSTPSSSPFATPKPDAGFTEDDLLLALEEASRRFPSLISKTAFVGRVSDDVSAAPSSIAEALDCKGCKIWLPESAMVASSIAPGSLVSVSLASSRKISISQPLCSLVDECAINFGFDLTEKLASDAGCYFALATVFPSSKLLKNAVRLSPNLIHTMGDPASGRIVFVYPVCDRAVMRNLGELDKSECNSGHAFSLYNCKELHLCLVSSKGKVTMNERMSSEIGLLDEIAEVQYTNRKISSPKTPSFSDSKLHSRSTGRLGTPKFEDSSSDSSQLQETSVDMLDVSEILADDNVRKLLQTCSASWLFSRNLLCGNFVVIPVLSRLCIFLVIGASSFSADGDFQNQSAKSNSKSMHLSPDLANHVNDGFLVTTGTKVYIHLSRNSETPTKVPPSLDPMHGDFSADKGVDFPKLGGLTKEFADLKDIIIASAVRATLSSTGLRATKGVLLHGPPGTGKTSLAQLCVHEAGISLFSVNGPEIISQYYGESERALHEVFDSASRALPAVVFIDELDAIAPARKDGGDELSHRMVATLLNLMDGISRTDGLVVIAATNRPDSIEPALRRPGRLDREIEIGVPSPKQRFEILLALLCNMEHSLSDADVHHLAGVTHGFVGADLAALCNESALSCLRRYAEFSVSFGGLVHNPSIADCDSYSISITGSSSGSKCGKDCSNNNLEELSSSITAMHISSNTVNGIEETGSGMTAQPILRVTFEDFEKARMKIRPSAMREVILEVPRVRWEDIGGQREVKMQLMEAVEWPQKHHDAFKRIGTRPPMGVLMFGPPGCSKTLLARAVASEAGLNFLAVKGPELFSKWVGESEKAVRSLFAKARANAPSIIFFDEIDGLAVIRGKESDGVSVSDRVMSQLLVELDGLHQRVNVTVIAATNRPDKIDPALLRPGRFDRLLYVGPPDKKDREDIFRVHLRKMPCGSDVCIEELALFTEGYTGADISLICREAAIAAIEEHFNASEIMMKHLKAGIQQVQPSEIQSYENLSNKFQRLVHSTVITL